MPLVKSILKLALQDAFKQSLSTIAGYPMLDAKFNEAAQVFSEKAADAIDEYIKSATIIIQPGQAVTTTGGAGSTTSQSLPATIS